MKTMIVLAAMLCGPSLAHAQQPPRAWHLSAAGKPVWGWINPDGSIGYFPQEQPPGPATPPAPAPVPAPATPPAQGDAAPNYGVEMAGLKQQAAGVMTTNDAGFRPGPSAEDARCPDREPTPSPRTASIPLAYVVVGVVAAYFLFRRPPRR